MNLRPYKGLAGFWVLGFGFRRGFVDTFVQLHVHPGEPESGLRLSLDFSLRMKSSAVVSHFEAQYGSLLRRWGNVRTRD